MLIDIETIASILACEIEAGVFETHIAPALDVARKTAAESLSVADVWVVNGDFTEEAFTDFEEAHKYACTIGATVSPRYALASAAPAEGREDGDERASFEYWAAKENIDLTRSAIDYEYVSFIANVAWSAWQGRASLPALATAPTISEAAQAFIQECAALGGKMVNGNRLSAKAASILAEIDRAAAKTSKDMNKLPDGSGFFVGSLPLPKDHWIYAPRGDWDKERDCFAEQPKPILTHEQRDAVIEAIRYAVRGATMCGRDMDFDPDAMVQNAVVALCGFYGFERAAAKGESE